MKILWIVNSVLNDLSQELFGKPSNGVWMDALLSDFKGKGGYEIVVATTAKRKNVYSYKNQNIAYYLLPDSPPLTYNENKKSNIAVWKSLIQTEKPDLIQVWGTEFTHGLCALRVAKGIPSIVYMQGYLGSIARYYQAGIPIKDLKKTVTFRDFIKGDSILQQQKKYYRSAKKEAEILRLSGSIISENEWCNANIRSVVPNIKVYSCPLSINKTFSKKEWNIATIDRRSIICTASGYTIKGLHMLLRAVALLKIEFPEIKLYVPGTPVVSDGSIKWLLRKRGYTKYIETLIRQLGIGENIVWLGRLSQEELAEEYAKRHVFVMPSAIENHSSSLKEAMAVGMPCVSSYVGGIPEYVRHGKNGLLYRFEEYEVLADHIKRIFTDDEFATNLSSNAKKDMASLHNGSEFEQICDIYRNLK